MPEYKPLPKEALAVLEDAAVSPRLVAHLILVHDVATELVARIRIAFPELQFEEEEVFFGAATHDIGKTLHTEELVQPGKLHEPSGAGWMMSLGVPERRARFAVTHGNWNASLTLQMEDLLVALADNCWKGKRVSDLENKVVDEIARQTGKADWEAFLTLDDILQEISARSDERLAWQAEFPI